MVYQYLKIDLGIQKVIIVIEYPALLVEMHCTRFTFSIMHYSLSDLVGIYLKEPVK